MERFSIPSSAAEKNEANVTYVSVLIMENIIDLLV